MVRWTSRVFTALIVVAGLGQMLPGAAGAEVAQVDRAAIGTAFSAYITVCENVAKPMINAYIHAVISASQPKHYK
jgi:hypothetical protein